MVPVDGFATKPEEGVGILRILIGDFEFEVLLTSRNVGNVFLEPRRVLARPGRVWVPHLGDTGGAE